MDLLEFDTVQRFGLSGDSERIRLSPRLADRPVVTTPQKPFYISPADSVTIYVGSPLWVRVEMIGSSRSDGEDSGEATLLVETPAVRPSDTWFGPTPYHGELCYASSTFCRLRLEEVTIRPYRAVTAATVTNHTDQPFLLERFKLPVLYLPLFSDQDSKFWTRDVKLDFRADEELSPLEYGPATPQHARDPELVSSPREVAEKNVAVRVFSSLFAG